ncbi:MerR family transcriptional regulator [Enterococcus lactis]|uniref:MerR family transcriptional regulator n=1 Tax=Enterococcus lactis TaxID=357441 RepID=UPI0039A41DED
MNIKKAAEKFDLTPDTLRYYERVGAIPPVHRNKSGYREYTSNNLNWIFLAKYLRSTGVSIKSLIEFTQLSQSEEIAHLNLAQKQILSEQIEKLDLRIAEMNEARSFFAHTIDNCDKDTKLKMNDITIDKNE